MKLSIVITCFNREKYISRCLESCVNFYGSVQNGSNGDAFDLVVVDDGSTDRSVDIIQSYQSKFELLRASFSLIVHDVNKGVSSAKNTGIRASIGDWVIVLDSDDYINVEYSNKVFGVIKGMHESVGLIFFVSQGLGGEVFIRKTYNHNDYVSEGLNIPESLPCIRRLSLTSELYDEKIHGFEGLLYSNILKNDCQLLLLTIPIRYYDTAHDDRITSKYISFCRSRHMFLGYYKFIKQNSIYPFRQYSIKTVFTYYILLVYHFVFSRFCR